MDVLRSCTAWIARRAVWTLPRPVLTVILVVEALAVAALIAWSATAGGPPVRPGQLWVALVLVAAGVASTESCLGVERVRTRSVDSPHIDLSSVWIFAAALTLPGPLAVAVAAAVHLHLYLRVMRHAGVQPHRMLFSTSTVVLSVLGAAAIVSAAGPVDLFRSPAGLLVVCLAVFAHSAVNLLLVGVVIVLNDGCRGRAAIDAVIARRDEVVLEFATLFMGALTAGAMSAFGEAYALLVLPPLMVLHRTVLVRQLEEAARTDAKTGLLNAGAWHLSAGGALHRIQRAGGAASVLVIDLDHFKRVNDHYGHLVGDQVLAVVAATLRAEFREEDVVGRFGGEEFVVLLTGPGGGEDACGAAAAAAERIRSRIAGLVIPISGPAGEPRVGRITASVGGATAPHDGHELAALLEVADAAMYAAKAAGRDAVRMGLQVTSTEPPGTIAG